MYWKYSVGFLIASLVQAGIIFIAESLGISTLQAQFNPGQLINHVLAGQAAGFLLMVILQSLSWPRHLDYWLAGSLYGIIVWAILIPINVAQGGINAPWLQGLPTLFTTLLAFVVYGVIARYTIKSETLVIHG